MKIIDRYLIKQYIQTFLFAILAFVMIFVVLDMMEKLDDFIDQSVPAMVIIQYYFVFIPEIMRLIIPVAVLLAALFTVGRMSDQYELAALKACGVSFYRFMAPFIITTLLISFFSVWFGGYIVPLANKHKVYIERHYMKKDMINPGYNIFFQDSPTRIVTISYFDVNRSRATRTGIQEFDNKNLTRMTKRIDADKMAFDTTSGNWILTKGTSRLFGKMSEKVETFDTLVIADLNFAPDDVIKKQQKPEEMTLDEISELAQNQLRSGNDPTRTEIEYHSRIALAFSSIIVILFGLPLSANTRKGGLAIQVALNLVVAFVYLAFLQISQAFGKNGVLNPVLTAWLANIVFFSGAIINIIRARK